MKKKFKILCPLLLVMGFLIFPCASRHVQASEKPEKQEITDAIKTRFRTFIDRIATREIESGNPTNGYVVFWNRIGQLCVAILPAPDVVGYRVDAYGNEYADVGYNRSFKHEVLCYWYSVKYDYMECRSPQTGNGDCFFDLYNPDDWSDTIAYSNFDFKDSDGNVFFARRSLAVPDLLKTCEGAKMQTEITETAKVTVLTAVSFLLLFPVLVRFIKKSLGLLVR